MRYAEEWEQIVNRMGRWIDFKNDYKTLYPWYMESIWFIFKELYNKGLVYKGVKVMPYSTSCNTPLSNFESGQNYKEVTDPSVVVAFPLLDDPNTCLLAWTTTPWTLPSNLALCCHPDFEYVKVKDKATGRTYVLLESSLSLVYKNADLYEIVGKVLGKDLKGKQYEPPFSYFSHLRAKGAFRVLNDTYVTAESGVGIVHQAPYFGEEDHRISLAAGIITKDQKPVCPIDASGRFVEPVNDFLGVYVKTADKDIIKKLQKEGKMVHSGTSKHSYPFCWRSDTPLIYRAVPSWFIRVESMKDKLLEACSDIYWVPDQVKEKRFGNWLRDARDWAFSRNRYWGNPIPLWVSEDEKEIVCVGSIAELEELTGKKVADLHRESIDDLVIPSKRPGCPPLRRIPEVFDCWFESGSMPYAQMHYPFEHVKEFNESFPADFIAEGIDQTRGWFYTLLVISTALFGKAPFKNLISNGLILASDGQKMSKSKKNYPDPMEVVSKYGADSLRLYLINSPVVRAENLRFKEEGVRDIIKDVFLPWYNAFRFLMQNIERFEREESAKFIYDETNEKSVSANTMDRWILSFSQSLLEFYKQEMSAYRLYTVVPQLLKFIDNLTNWYVRMNRRRIKGETAGGVEDCRRALNTLFRILYTMIRINAPFTPFLAEFMYQRLSKLLPPSKDSRESVHYEMIPESALNLIDKKIERAVSHMQTIIELGRVVRDRKTIPIKYPLPEVVVIHQDPLVLEEIVALKSYITEELNVKELTVSTNKEKYGVMLRAEPDHKTLGARLKGEFKQITQAIKELSDSQLQQLLKTKEIEVLGHKIKEEEVRLMFTFTGPAAEELSKRYETHSEGNVLILLDVTPDETMLNEGIAREIINRVQKLRKKAQLVPSDKATVYYDIPDKNSSLAKVAVSHQQYIENTSKTPMMNISALPKGSKSIIEEAQQVKGVVLKLILVSNSTDSNTPKAVANKTLSNVKSATEAQLKFVCVELVDLPLRFGAASANGTVFIEQLNKKGFITYQQLRDEIDLIFGLYGCHYDLFVDGKQLDKNSDISKLSEKVVYAVNSSTPTSAAPAKSKKVSRPSNQFANVKNGEKKGSVLLENPVGSPVDEMSITDILSQMLGKSLSVQDINSVLSS